MQTIKTKTEKERSGTSAGAVTEYLGICATCNHAPTCAHRMRNPGVAIWECENYDDYVRLNGTFVGGAEGEASAPAKSRPRDDSGSQVEYRGLCKNCAKREYCTFRRPEGGVWHCEEYE